MSHSFRFFFLSVLLAAALFASCDNDTLYCESIRIDEKGWDLNNPLSFSFDVNDTSTTYICYVDIRNTRHYHYSNLFLSIQTIFPHGEIATDTNIEFVLAKPDGEWLGRTTGRYIDGRYPLCYITFPEVGNYQFIINHAMRDTVLQGIKDIGVVICEQR